MTIVLDPKRSNAINIGLTTLPPVHVIKAALVNFDEFAVSKDGIEVGIARWGCGREWEVQPSPLVSGHGLGIADPRPWGSPRLPRGSQDQHLRPQASTYWPVWGGGCVLRNY